MRIVRIFKQKNAAGELIAVSGVFKLNGVDHNVRLTVKGASLDAIKALPKVERKEAFRVEFRRKGALMRDDVLNALPDAIEVTGADLNDDFGGVDL